MLLLANVAVALASEPDGRTLVVGSEENFPPFTIGDSSQPAAGYTIELWEEVAKEAGIDYAIRVRPWGQILQEFREGKIDVLINVATSAERDRYVDFSVPHVKVHGAIFVRKDDRRIASEADLPGKKIIVFRSDLAHEYAVSKGWQNNLVLVDSTAEGLELLASGKHDAMLVNKIAGLQTLKGLKLDNVVAVDAAAGYSQKFSFGVREGDAELLAHINEALAVTKSTGVYDALYNKWFGIYESKTPSFRDMLPYLVPVILLTLATAAYNFRNRRLERKSAAEALAASERNLRLILDSAGEAIYGIDNDGKCTFCNSTCVKMLGYHSPDDLLGKDMHALMHHSRADGASFPPDQCRIIGSIRSGEGVVVDDEVLWRSDGTSFVAEYRCYPQIKDGKPVGAVVTFIDITERKFKESAHQQAGHLIHLASSHSNLHDCIAQLTASLKNWTGCEAVAIRLRDGDDFTYYETAGLPPAFVEAESSLCAYGSDGQMLRGEDGTPLLQCLCGNVLSQRFDSSESCFTPHGSFWCNSTSALRDASRFCPEGSMRSGCIEAGYQSLALVPMSAGDQVVGLIQFADRHPDRFTPYLVELIEGVAEKIALALRRRQAEKELERREKLHHDLLNTIPDLIWLKDTEGVYILCNTTFERFFGAREEQIVGKTDYDYLEKELADFFRANDRRAMEAGIPTSNEEWITFADDGHRALLQTIKTPMYDSEGEVLGILGIGRDITGLRQAEEAMRESEMRLRYALEGTNDGLWDVQLANGRTYLSPRSCEMLGYGADEIDNSRLWSELVHPDDLALSGERLQAHKEGRSDSFEVEQRLRTKGGTWKWIHTRGKVVERAEDGAPVRITGTYSDITEKKSLEWQLQQAQKMESVGRLAGGVAHDFNNMLGVIIGHAALALMDTDPSHPTHGHLMEIDKAAERSADLTRQLLAFARQQTIAPRLLDLNDTIAGMLKMLKRLIGEDIQLCWHPGTDAGLIKMDPSQIDQILANLCVNARDAIEDVGKIFIETGSITIDRNYSITHPDAVPGDYVWLAVTDNGRGMDKQTLSHIYEPFFTTKGMGEGTGLGLATVYGAVKQNNGFINVYSEVGHGTTFTIYIPKETEKSAESGREPVVDPPPRGSETVLVVEDEPAILNMAAMILETQGYTALQALSAREAIRIALEHEGEIHLLMTDVIMPEMNGRDLAAAVLAAQPKIKRLYMSGYTADVIAHHGVLDQGLHFIQKPFSLSDLASKVRQVLDGN